MSTRFFLRTAGMMILLFLGAGLIAPGCETPEARTPGIAAPTPPKAPAKPQASAAKRNFDRLYKMYAARFHEKMVTDAETLAPVQITVEAARLWDETFALHKDVLRARAAEVLQELDAAAPIQEDLYIEVASGARPDPAHVIKGIALKQHVWSPVGAAQMGLNNWLERLLQPESFKKRTLLFFNAAPAWEALDRNPDKPILLQRQGPMLFVFALEREDDYYQITRIRWLRPKAMGPIVTPAPPPEQ